MMKYRSRSKMNSDTNTEGEPNPLLDALLEQWRERQMLSSAESQDLRRRVAIKVSEKGRELDAAWWKNCLGSGLAPLRTSQAPIRLAFRYGG
ncbi:MAG: hypothetical protein P4L46_13585 [Fimbriimonas sp.]|nr:hypothetical protein [Fimbriimonas sp.]